MTDTINPYSPVIERPPTNSSIRIRKTSRDRLHNNIHGISASHKQRQVNDAHENVRHQNTNESDSGYGNSLSIQTSSVERSLSWGNLRTPPSADNHHLKTTCLVDNQRSLSASNLYALADPALSIKAAISRKPYDKPHTSFSKEKAVFTAWTQKYYHQLTIGCGDITCKNIFCKSSPRRMKFDCQTVALISIELAGYKNNYLCVKDEKKQSAKVLDSNIFKNQEDNEQILHNDKEFGKVPFLYTFYSMSPFRSLFLPCPLTPSGLGLHKTHSYSDLHTPTKIHANGDDNSSITYTMKNHLDSITNTISSSFSNIFKMVSTETTTVTFDEERKAFHGGDDDGPFELTPKESNWQKSPNEGTENGENRIITRKRIPSVRIFGSDHAVDTEPEVQDKIDDFETKVAAEFRPDSVDEDALFDDDVDDVIEPESSSDEQAPDGFSLTHLTFDMFDNVVKNYRECKDETFLLNTLRTVFSSWDALKVSFQDGELIGPSKYPFNVKISDVIEVFKLLEKIENSEKLKAVLTDTIQVMLLKKHSIREPSELTPFVIILSMPYLFNYSQVVYELAHAISILPCNCLQVLAEFLAECFTEAQLKFLVLGIKSQIKSESTWNSPTLQNNQLVVSLCKTMHLLYNANNCHGNHQPIIPNSTFYCDELTSKIDFKQAYSFWKRMFSSRQSTSNSILDYPFLLEPGVKVQVIHIDAITQMREEYQDAIVHQARVQQVQKSWSDFNDSSKMSQEVRSAMCPYLLLEIRREKLIEDTLKQLQERSSDLKKPLKIKYMSGGEQGLDMGGLQKEFFQVIVETVFDSNYGLFNQSEDGHVVWFNTFSFESNVMFELVGILLGLAIYNGIILDIHFPLLVYKKLLGDKVGLDELYEIQPTLAGGFSQLLQYDGDVENDFLQTFEVSHNVYGKTVEMELIPDGKNVPVTNSNRKRFVDLYVDFILNQSVASQFEAFKKGFYQVCNGPTIKLFTPPELELLVCGNPDLDFKALESVTEYRDGYVRNHSLMINFWDIVHRFSFQQKQALLMFVTGSYRVPLKGLGSMSFYIQRNGPDSNNLPTSMTCFNRLLLPEYTSADKLERMLLLAIENSKGFGLT